MSILLLYNYKQLTECISEVERIEAIKWKVSYSNKRKKKKERVGVYTDIEFST
jgi:hypothetical protein